MPASKSERRSCPCKTIPWSLSSFSAAEFGEVNSLLTRRSVWNRRDSAGYSPLHLAAQHNHVGVTSLLLRSGVNVNGVCDNADPLASDKYNTATPLHRASFAGATATMRLLLLEQDCDILARDNSFGDQKTPLHKAAAGGRYLAIQLLLEHLRGRGLLAEALMILDSSSRTPLQVAQDFLPCQDNERESVARWDVIAGGIADWTKCVALLEIASRSASLHRSVAVTYKDTLPLPPQILSSVEACIDCGPSSDGYCLNLSWQAALHSALESAVASSLSTISFHEPQRAVGGTVEKDHAKLERRIGGVPHPQDTRNDQSLTMGVFCRMCHQETVSLFLSASGVLVCKACRISTR